MKWIVVEWRKLYTSICLDVINTVGALIRNERNEMKWNVKKKNQNLSVRFWFVFIEWVRRLINVHNISLKFFYTYARRFSMHITILHTNSIHSKIYVTRVLHTKYWKIWQKKHTIYVRSVQRLTSDWVAFPSRLDEKGEDSCTLYIFLCLTHRSAQTQFAQ